MNFEEIYATRPDQADHGSSGYSRLKHLYDLCQEINPEYIAESGTWKGNSSYLFRNARPETQLACFDITFKHLRWKSPDIYYYEHDIEKFANWDNYFYAKTTLLFFDDHIDQLKRLYWAHSIGFKHLIFDDNVPLDEWRNLKNPPRITLQMLPHLPSFVEEYRILPWLGKELRNTYLTYVKLK